MRMNIYSTSRPWLSGTTLETSDSNISLQDLLYERRLCYMAEQVGLFRGQQLPVSQLAV